MTFTALELISEHACFGGVQRFYKHSSSEIGLPMRFGLYLPQQALAGQKVPLLTYLVRSAWRRNGGWPSSPPTPARAALAFWAKATTGSSVWVPASIWTPPNRPGPATGAWRATSSRSCCPM
jgi:S-formylglutathione hydrolase FrmB